MSNFLSISIINGPITIHENKQAQDATAKGIHIQLFISYSGIVSQLDSISYNLMLVNTILHTKVIESPLNHLLIIVS